MVPRICSKEQLKGKSQAQRHAKDNQAGASFLEYALLLTLIVVAGLAAVQALKDSVSTQFSVVSSSI